MMSNVLVRPFAYLSIQHDSSLPAWVNWAIPMILAGLACALFTWIGFGAGLVSDNGFFARVLGFTQGLAGFYIAALAAIATFSNADMDQLMPGNPPTLVIHHNSGKETIRLSRRRFLSQLFAYLTALSFVISLVSIMALAVGVNVKTIFNPAYVNLAKIVFLFFYFLVLSQMTTITLWGIYYLGERIHTPDS